MEKKDEHTELLRRHWWMEPTYSKFRGTRLRMIDLTLTWRLPLGRTEWQMLKYWIHAWGRGCAGPTKSITSECTAKLKFISEDKKKNKKTNKIYKFLSDSNDIQCRGQGKSSCWNWLRCWLLKKYDQHWRSKGRGSLEEIPHSCCWRGHQGGWSSVEHQGK